MLTGSVIMITGAAGKIGAALARRAVAEGSQVVLVDINNEALGKLETELRSSETLAVLADASVVDDVDRCIAAAKNRFGKVNAAVHLAYPRSSSWGAKFEELEKEFLNEDLSAQLGGAILFSQRVLEFFKKQGHGNLIHVSSIMGVATPKFENYVGANMTSPLEYTVMKAGLISMTRYLAKYYRGNNIRINCVSPGGILENQPLSFQEKYRASCNSKGMLDSGDIVGAFLYLLSEHSGFVTGQNIIVDDGWSL